MKVESKLEIIEKLYNHSFKQISYFQNDITKFKIFLLVIKNHQLDSSQTIEELIDELPKTISSRAHKFNCITDATKKNYFIKETSNSDQRKKYLKPSQELLDELNEFLKILN